MPRLALLNVTGAVAPKLRQMVAEEMPPCPRNTMPGCSMLMVARKSDSGSSMTPPPNSTATS
jgi:hypothetical protein